MWSRRWWAVTGWLALLAAIGGVVLLYAAWPDLRAEFYFDEAWRADLIRSPHPLSRYRTHNTPIPPLWVGILKATSQVLPDGFTGLRLQNLALSTVFPVGGGVLAATLLGWTHRARALALSVATTLLLAMVLAITGLALYLNDYAFQAAAVAALLVACVLADRGQVSRTWAGVAMVSLPLATIGGLVVLPGVAAWWVLGDDRPANARALARRGVVPAISAAVAVFVYLWLYRPQVDAGLEDFWGAELLRDATRGLGAVAVDIPRSLAEGMVPTRYEWARNAGVGCLIAALAIAGLWALGRWWRWLPLVVATSWPVAAILSVAGAWPVTFVRVNLPFVWLWYLSALVGAATGVSWLLRQRATVAYAVCAAACIPLLPARSPVNNAVFARGLYNDLRLIETSPYEHNIVLAYHFMSHFYVDDALENISGQDDRFTVVREVPRSDDLYSATDQALLDAGWTPGTAVWCVMPYELGPDGTDRACHVSLPGLQEEAPVRADRAMIVAWVPTT